jgi:hypothetical protein
MMCCVFLSGVLRVNLTYPGSGGIPPTGPCVFRRDLGDCTMPVVGTVAPIQANLPDWMLMEHRFRRGERVVGVVLRSIGMDKNRE